MCGGHILSLILHRIDRLAHGPDRHTSLGDRRSRMHPKESGACGLTTAAAVSGWSFLSFQ